MLILPDRDDRRDDADLQSGTFPACRPARYAPRRTRRSATGRSGDAAGRVQPAFVSRLAHRSCPSLDCDAASISLSSSRPTNERLPRKLPKWPSSSQNTTTSTPRSARRGILGDRARRLQRIDAARAARRAIRHNSGFRDASRTRPFRPVAAAACRECWRRRRFPRRGRPRACGSTNHSRAAMS